MPAWTGAVRPSVPSKRKGPKNDAVTEGDSVAVGDCDEVADIDDV